MWNEMWAHVTESVSAEIAAGRRHLLTEDFVRHATVVALDEHDVDASRLEYEWRPPDRNNVQYDLVVDTPPSAIIEFKFPRAPRAGNRPYTQVVGPLLADFYKLYDASANERFAVLVLEADLVRHLEGRSEFEWRIGRSLTLPLGLPNRLPQTAGGQLRSWSETGPVQASCSFVAAAGDLTIVSYAVVGSS